MRWFRCRVIRYFNYYKMTPANYLSELGLDYFNRICGYLGDKLQESDSIELSMLANLYAMHDEAVAAGSKVGFVNEFPNGTIQANGYQTIIDRCYSTILKHGAKFGLNPSDREKLASSIKPVKTKKSFI